MPNLSAELRARRLAQSAEVIAAYDATVSELIARGFVENVLGVGEAFPDVILPNAEGELVAIAELLARRPTVVTFFRGTWCPYCRLMLDALAAAVPEIEAAGGQLVAVTPETGGRALAAKRNHRARFEILSDVDSGLGLACRVVFRVPEVYQALMLKHGTDLAERQGNAAWFLPVPATFVVDRAGIVRWRFAVADFTRRAEPSEVIATVAALERAPH